MVQSFFQVLEESLTGETLIALTLSNRRKGNAHQPRRQSIRPVELRGESFYQWESQFARQQTHENLPQAETLNRIRETFGSVYREAYLYTAEADWMARGSSPQSIKLTRRPPSRQESTIISKGHDRQKEHLLPEGVPCPYLIALDVMTASGQVKQSRQKKFRQINRYVEIVNDIYPQLPGKGPLRVVDFGCGLSYLTFAVHDLLHRVHGRETQLIGIDQNPDVVARAQSIATDLQLPGLQFQTSSIQTFEQGEPVDLVISLHACDTATDAALAWAVRSEARAILAAPCCQRELFQQIECAELAPALGHGIIKERTAALFTDSLRAQALEAVGYRTQILEFIETEHTPKNLLLRAVRRPAASRTPADLAGPRAEYERFKTLLGACDLATDALLQSLPEEG